MNDLNITEAFKKIEDLNRDNSAKNIKDMAPQILQAFMASLRRNDEFEIAISNEMWQKCSVVKYDFLDLNMQAELRQKPRDYELNLLFYSAGLVSHRHRLTSDEVELIPPGLKKLMSIVRDLGENVKFSGGSIDDHQA